MAANYLHVTDTIKSRVERNPELLGTLQVKSVVINLSKKDFFMDNRVCASLDLHKGNEIYKFHSYRELEYFFLGVQAQMDGDI